MPTLRRFYTTILSPNPTAKAITVLPSGIILISDMQEGLFIFQGVADNCSATETLRPVDLSCPEINSSFGQAAAMLDGFL